MSKNDDTKITVYRTSWCAFCHAEMQWLDKLGIVYEAKDVEADQDAYRELLDKMGGSYTGVPVTSIGEDVILGFDRPKLQASMEKYGISPAA